MRPERALQQPCFGYRLRARRGGRVAEGARLEIV